MYLLEFNEIQKEVIWGGTLLASVYSKPFDKSKAIGESWEICDLPNDNSVVSNGELKGKTLSYLVKEYGSELLGTKCKEDYFERENKSENLTAFYERKTQERLSVFKRMAYNFDGFWD